MKLEAFKHLKSNWFRYGFETLAVIVGILAAFALDNWNEERKQEIEEMIYLGSLLEDLAFDTAYYNNRLSDSEWIVKQHHEYINHAYLTQKSIEDVKNLLGYINWNSELLTTQNSTYVELINSGSLSLIRNQELKSMIVDYYRENEMAAKHIGEFNEVSTRHLIQVGNVIPNLVKFYKWEEELYEERNRYYEGEWDFFNDKTSLKFQTLEHAVTIYRYKHRAFARHFKSLKELSVQLISDIESELETRK